MHKDSQLFDPSTPPISVFRGQYRFLSNFFPSTVLSPTLEHHYQAAKAINPWDRHKIISAPSPGIAKRLGRNVKLVDGWDKIKLQVMKDLIIRKFQDPALRRLLLNTGTHELIHGNDHGDDYWGRVDIGGKLVGWNHLGRLLMEVREQLRGTRN